MDNKFKETDIKSCAYYSFDDIINIKYFNTNKIKVDEKSYKNILVYCIRYLTIKCSKCVKINSPFINLIINLIIGKVNGRFEEINGNEHFTLVPPNESKKIMKKYEGLWSKSDI